VGYKFYETAAEEGLINYEEQVQYPFGYGLSYTTFDKTIGNFKRSATAAEKGEKTKKKVDAEEE